MGLNLRDERIVANDDISLKKEGRDACLSFGFLQEGRGGGVAVKVVEVVSVDLALPGGGCDGGSEDEAGCIETHAISTTTVSMRIDR